MKTFKKSISTAALLAIVLPLTYSNYAYARPDAPDNFTGVLSGNSVTLQWEPVADAAGYNVYVNNNYMTTTSNTEYVASVDGNQVNNFYVTAFTNNPTEFSSRSEPLTLSNEALPNVVAPNDLTIPPSVPGGLSGSIEGTNVTLTWEPSTDDEAVAGYNVYQNNQYLTTVFDTQYQGSVVAGETYTYGIVAFDTRVNFSSTSTRLTLPESGESSGSGGSTSTPNTPETSDATAPSEPSGGSNETTTDGPLTTPTGFSGAITDSGTDSSTVLLSWNAPSGVRGYNVYENGDYKSTVFSTEYRGSVDANSTNSFYIVAFDFDNNFAQRTTSLVVSDAEGDSSVASDAEGDSSVASDTEGDSSVVSDAEDDSSETTTGVDTQAPAAPTNLIGTWNPNSNGTTADVELTWTTPSDNIGVVGYNIYENRNYIATVRTNSYSTTVNADGAYSYRIVAFDEARNYSTASFSESLPNGGNQPPIFVDFGDRTEFAGDDINIVIRPRDNDGGVPGLFIGNLPTGMSSVDNFDGTRSLIWRPLQPDVGQYQITATAFDAADPSIQTVQTFTLTLELPEDQSNIRNARPGIDAIADQIVRVGDTVNLAVKATDANGTVPDLTMLNLPAGATFITDSEEENIKILTWTTSSSDTGLNTLDFFARDSVDPNLTVTSDVVVNVVESSQFNRSGDRLKNLASRHDKLIGYASVLNFHEKPDADLYRATAAQEFNMVTAENSMKWAYINPEPGEFRFEAADTLMGFASANDMTIHGHTLVWYAALPQWVQTSNVDEREGLMNAFIDTMTSRYNQVDVWDVVNEAFEDNGDFRNSVWFQAMGEGHIEKAFRRARSGAPNAELIYNDYDIASGGPKTDATFALMESLIAKGAPIDGIGFQMHIDADYTDFSSIENTFNRFANLGLDIYITEFDVSQVSGTNEDDQARVFSNVTRLCLEQSACKALQFWGFTDRYTWLRNDTPLLLDRDYQPKPSYFRVQEALGSN